MQQMQALYGINAPLMIKLTVNGQHLYIINNNTTMQRSITYQHDVCNEAIEEQLDCYIEVYLKIDSKLQSIAFMIWLVVRPAEKRPCLVPLMC